MCNLIFSRAAAVPELAPFTSTSSHHANTAALGSQMTRHIAQYTAERGAHTMKNGDA